MGVQNTNQVPKAAGAVVVDKFGYSLGDACIVPIVVVDFFAVAEQGSAA